MAKASKARWTRFWKNLGSDIDSTDRTFFRDFKPKREIGRLKRMGLEADTVEAVIKRFENLATNHGKKQFYRFARFFTRSPFTVVQYLGANTLDASFLKLANILTRTSIDNVEKRFGEIARLYHRQNRGRGTYLEADLKRRIPLGSIQAKDFTSVLSRRLGKKYRTQNAFNYHYRHVVSFIKDEGSRRVVHKFVELRKNGKKVEMFIPGDSRIETHIIRTVLAGKIGSYPLPLRAEGSFSKLRRFVRSGESKHFRLVGIKLQKGDYEITALPIHRRIANISQLDSSMFTDVVEDDILELRLFHKELKNKNVFYVRFISFRHGGLVGSIFLKLFDNKLDEKLIETVRNDFLEDFKIPLGSFIQHENFSPGEICRVFLENTSRTTKEIEVSSKKAWKIVKTITNFGLITNEYESKEQKLFCFQPGCSRQYETQWNIKYCACGSPLYPDSTIVSKKISPEQVTKFLNQYAKDNGLPYANFKKSILGKKNVLTQIILGKGKAEFLPVTHRASKEELGIASARFPQAIILDTKGQAQSIFQNHKIVAEPLHQFFDRLVFKGSQGYLFDLLKRNQLNEIDSLRHKATESANRLGNMRRYAHMKRGRGAEFFEMDCHAILNYLFGNAIWLGAKERGKKVPDGISALPIRIEGRDGCFIWDAKYSRGKGKTVTLGSNKKNQKYVTDAKKNQSIKDHGGLKSFIFIGNKPPPNSFEKNFCRIARTTRGLKCNFMSQVNLLKIFEHFKLNEGEILGNDEIRNAFLEFFKDLFWKKSGGIGAEFLSEDKVETSIQGNQDKINALKTKLNI